MPDAENSANVYPLLQRVSDLSAVELADFLCLADAHHVTVRALEALGRSASTVPGHERIRTWCENTLAHEGARSLMRWIILSPSVPPWRRPGHRWR